MQKLNREKQLEVVLVICLGLTVLFFITKNKYLLMASLALGIAGVTFPKAVYWTAFLWLKLGEVLGSVSSKIILSLIYFLVLVPIAFVAKLTKRDTSFTAAKKETYYHNRTHRFSPRDLENTW